MKTNRAHKTTTVAEGSALVGVIVTDRSAELAREALQKALDREAAELKAFRVELERQRIEDWETWRSHLIADAKKNFGIEAPSMTALRDAVKARAGTLAAMALGVLPADETLISPRALDMCHFFSQEKPLEVTVRFLNSLAVELDDFLSNPRPVSDAEIRAETQKAKLRDQKRGRRGLGQQKGGRK